MIRLTAYRRRTRITRKKNERKGPRFLKICQGGSVLLRGPKSSSPGWNLNSTFSRTGQYSPFMSIKMANEVNCGVLYPKRIPTVETNTRMHVIIETTY